MALIAILAAAALTVAAVVALNFQINRSVRLALIGVFTFLVAGVLSLCGARKAEVFMGTVG